MFVSKPIATELAEVAKLEGSPLQSSYRNTIYCNAILTQEGGKVRGTYCGNRWCMTCARIRTGMAMERYLPTLKAWGDVWFVTLTVRNVPAAELRDTIATMLAGFTAAKRAIKRTDGLEFVGLRKLECTYNALTDEYHPHFHVHVRGQAAARALVRRWLDYFPDVTDAQAQDCRPVDGTDDSLREIFKYFTKLVAKRKLMPAKALDVIFRAMRGRRVYQPVGFTVANDDDDEGDLELDKGTPAISRPGEELRWEWSQQASDWVDADTGECLTGYEPAEKLRELLTIKRDLPPVRGIPSESSNADVRELRAAMTKKLEHAARQRAPLAPAKVLSKQLQKIFALSRERADTMAAQLDTGGDTQISFARELGVSVREFTREREFM
jgi:hypothetical protein